MLIKKNMRYSPPLPHFGLIGHRGVASMAPENSLKSFLLARQLGLNWIEFDIQLTKDLHWVVFHDDELTRTSNGFGTIYEQNLMYLKSLDSGGWFSKYYLDTPMATLTEVLHFIQSIRLFPNIEIKIAKNAPLDPPMIGQSILKILHEHWQQETLPLISSFNHSILFWIKKNAPRYPLGFLFESDEDMTSEYFEIDNISLHFGYHSENDMDKIKSMAQLKPLIPYTINSYDDFVKLRQAGCYAAFTDYPQKFIPKLCKDNLMC